MTNSDWRVIGTWGTIVGAIVMLHGVTSKNWRTAHTVASILTVAAVLGPRLRD
jgi:hypothetical protein